MPVRSSGLTSAQPQSQLTWIRSNLSFGQPVRTAGKKLEDVLIGKDLRFRPKSEVALASNLRLHRHPHHQKAGARRSPRKRHDGDLVAFVCFLPPTRTPELTVSPD